MADQQFRIIAPTAIVGYGFQESSLERALLKNPHLIACDFRGNQQSRVISIMNT